MKIAWLIVRPVLAILAGNLAGYAAFRLALGLTSGLWRSGISPARPAGDFGLRILLTALTAILFAAPPVLLGAVTARLAGSARMWAGMAGGLWGVGFAWWWPDLTPILSPQSWLGPTVLILLSGLIGGWLMDVRASTKVSLKL